jgi:hypothetical protein
MTHRLALAAVLAAAVLGSVAHAQRPQAPQGPLYAGYLCCNMYTYGSQMGDGNYREAGTSLVPVGTPAQVTGYEMRFIYTIVGGKVQRLKNDYSRDIAMAPFASRYIVKEDPKVRIAAFEPAIRDAILAAKVAEGMSREQVTMAIGWPITSENPQPQAKVWRYWTDSWTEYQVSFDDAGKVNAVTGTPAALDRVFFVPR